MCKAKAPNTSAQQAEAARQSQIEEQRYQQQLAAQQAEWERQRADAEARYQQQLQLQQAEIQRQLALQQSQQAATEAAAKAQADKAAQSAAWARDYTAQRDKAVQDAMGQVQGAYAGFDESYFNKFAADFVAANRGTIDRDAERDSRKAKYKLADGMNHNSSAAADVYHDIEQDKLARLSQVAAQGSANASAYRQNIEGQKLGALNSVFALGNTAAPDFTSADDYTGAVDKLAKNLGFLSGQVKGSTKNLYGAF